MASPSEGRERSGHGDNCSPAGTMKCSLRVWFLSMAFLLVFIMSLLFTYSHHSMATLPYLDSGAMGGTHRVKLVPGYAGLQRLSKEGLTGKSCACRRCMGDAGTSDWFDSHFDSNISPVWTRENMDLPPDVQRWWMVRAVVPPLPLCVRVILRASSWFSAISSYNSSALPQDLTMQKTHLVRAVYQGHKLWKG